MTPAPVQVSNGRMRFTPHLVVGGVVTLLGTALLLDQLGALDARSLLRFWPILLMIFGVSIVVQALSDDGHDTAGPGRRPIVGPGFVLLLLIVWLVSSNASDRRFVTAGASGDPELTLVGIMGRDDRTSMSTAFRGAQMTSVMGRTRLDLRQAAIAQGVEPTIEVFGLMGAIELIVPESWTLDVQTTAVMGGVRDRRGESEDDDADDDSRRSRRQRERAAQEDAGTRTPAESQTASPSTTPTGPVAVEPLASPTTSPAPPSTIRLVLRGTVMMGGLIIRS